ncbi:MAG: hypothetical protein K0R38_6874, partial [Polyangiaceae bacterium]|nr:hypothetical protein [Polyangiaceae bacterium]
MSGSGPGNTCDNDTKDGAETDVDCGGSVCTARCTTNQGCALVTDCRNDAAVSGTHHACDASKCRLRGCNA